MADAIDLSRGDFVCDIFFVIIDIITRGGLNISSPIYFVWQVSGLQAGEK